MTNETPAPKKLDSFYAWPVLGASIFFVALPVLQMPLGAVAFLAGVGAAGFGAVSYYTGDKQTPFIDRVKANAARVGKMLGFVGAAFSSVGVDLKNAAGVANRWGARQEEKATQETATPAKPAETTVSPLADKKITGFGRGAAPKAPTASQAAPVAAPKRDKVG